MQVREISTGWDEKSMPRVQPPRMELEQRALAEWPGMAGICLLLAAAFGFSLYFVEAPQVAYAFPAALFVLSVLLSPFLGLCILGVSIPLAGIVHLIPGMFTLSKGLALLVAVSVLLRARQVDLSGIFQQKTFRLYFFLLLWSLALIPFAFDTKYALLAVLVQSLMFGLCLLTVAALRNAWQLKVFCLSMLAGGALLGVAVLTLGLSSEVLSRSGERLSAGSNENELAGILGLLIVISFIALSGKQPSKGLLVTIIVLDGLVAVALALTYSRNGYIAILAAGLLGPLLARGVRLKNRGFWMLGIILLSAAAIFWGANYAPSEEAQRASDERFQQTGSEAWGGRLDYIWPRKIEVFLGNPLMGDGPGAGLAKHLDSHSDLMMLLSERGIVGVFLFLGILWALYKDGNRLRDPKLKIIVMALLVLTVMLGLTHSTFLKRSFPITLGIAIVVLRLNRQEGNEEERGWTQRPEEKRLTNGYPRLGHGRASKRTSLE